MKVKLSSLKSIYIYIAFALVFLSSDSIYGIYYGNIVALKLLVCVISLFAILLSYKNVQLKHLLWIGLFSVMFITWSKINGGDFDVWIMVLLRIVSLYPLVLLATNSKQSMIEMYSKFTYSVAIVFFVAYVLLLLFGDYLPYQVVRPSERLFLYRNYGGVLFQLPDQLKIFNFEFIRSHGFTWEAGQYQMYLNIALYYYLFFNAKEKKKIIFLITAIVCTFSTMGWLILCTQIFVYILDLKKGRLFVVLKCLLASLIVILFVMVLNEKSSSGSYAVRMLDMLNSYEIIRANLFFGTGVRSVGTTNGLLSLIADNGIMVIALIVLSFIKWIHSVNYQLGIKKSALFPVIFVLGLMNEPIQYTAFIFIVIWMMLMDTPVLKK